MEIDDLSTRFKGYFNDVQLAVIKQLTDDERRAFGFMMGDGRPARMKRDQLDKALALGRQVLNGRLKSAAAELPAAAGRIQQQGLEEAQIQTEGEITVANGTQEEQGKVTIVPAGQEPLLISTALASHD
jgi:hypothetical protein